MIPFPIGTAAVLVLHEGCGREKSVPARTVELGDSGATLETRCEVRPGTLAWVEFRALRVTAVAHVEECCEQGERYRVGLRFAWSRRAAGCLRPGCGSVGARRRAGL